MEIIFSLVFGVLLVFCAWSDWKRKDIPNLALAALWLSLFLSPNVVETFAIAGIGFTFIFFFNEFTYRYGKRQGPVFSWGDVLGVPAIVAAVIPLSPDGPYTNYFIFAMIALPFVVGALQKKETPAFVIWAPFYWIYFVIAANAIT